jgi:membrane associated rhomboid family serine protease
VKNYFQKKLYAISVLPLCFVATLWVIFLVCSYNNINLVKFGVLPRDIKGFLGIVTSIFIHGDLEHIASNSLPIIVLGMLLFFFYKKIAKQAFIWIWLISGTWLWIGGRNNDNHPIYHIGASTLIYGLATFLFFSGVFRKHLRLMVVSALVVFLYGSIMWGVFPFKNEISWEGHLFGAIAGLLVAFNYRKEGPQKQEHKWEEDEEDFEDDINTVEENSLDNNNVIINYVYKIKEDENLKS